MYLNAHYTTAKLKYLPKKPLEIVPNFKFDSTTVGQFTLVLNNTYKIGSAKRKFILLV